MAKKSMIAKANREPKHPGPGAAAAWVTAYMRRFALCRIFASARS